MRRVHWKIHSERHQTHPGTTYPPPPPPPPQSQPDHHHHQVSLVRQILERRLQNKKDVQTRERVNMCHPKNWNPSHSTYRKLKTGIFCPSKMCNWYGERFSRKLSCWSLCRVGVGPWWMGRSCLSTDRRVRWARMLSSNLHSNTLHTRQKYTNCALQCILYTVNRAERRQSIENARSGEEQSGERLYSSSSSGMRWRLATKILSGPGTNPIEVQDFCADLLNIAPTSFSFAPPPVRLQFMVVRPRWWVGDGQ